MIGVDFSGARDAGNKIWIAEGSSHSDGVAISRCFPAHDLPDSTTQKDKALAALVTYFADASDAIIGCDFPFSLPAPLIAEATWTGFVQNFARTYPTPDDFRAVCMSAAGGKELKRRCDVIARVPFSAYNLRLYRQTWEGIASVIAPLIADDRARVIPVQPSALEKPILVETCPASLLKAEDLYPSYKGATAAHRDARRKILSSLVRRKTLRPLASSLRRAVLDDKGGDALDAIIAAICATRASRDPRATQCADDIERIEARIFF